MSCNSESCVGKLPPMPLLGHQAGGHSQNALRLKRFEQMYTRHLEEVVLACWPGHLTRLRHQPVLQRQADRFGAGGRPEFG